MVEKEFELKISTKQAQANVDELNKSLELQEDLISEIENELNKEDKVLKRKQLKTSIALAEKGLSGDSFEEAILKSITGQQGKMPTGNKLAGILKATRGIDSIVLDGSQAKPGAEIKFVQDQVVENEKAGTPINEGAYVINSKILIIDEQGNVTQYY